MHEPDVNRSAGVITLNDAADLPSACINIEKDCTSDLTLSFIHDASSSGINMSRDLNDEDHWLSNPILLLLIMQHSIWDSATLVDRGWKKPPIKKPSTDDVK